MLHYPALSDRAAKELFINTAVDWNQLDNDTVHAKSVDSFKSTVAASLDQYVAPAVPHLCVKTRHLDASNVPHKTENKKKN